MAQRQPKPITFYRCSKQSAKAYLERIEGTIINGIDSREKLRIQLKALTLSLSVTIFGFVIGKESKVEWVLLLVPAFCLFMHILDTLLADLSKRQADFGTRLNKNLLSYEFLSDAEIELALNEAFAGNMPADWKKKVYLFFFPPLADSIWHWGLFFATLFLAKGVILWGIVTHLLLKW